MTVSAEQLRRLFSYDPSTGVFVRLVPSGRAAAGRVAGTPHSEGYLTIRVGGRKHFVHRLAWLYMTGKWPLGRIDHRNADRTDNRWSNLRDVDAVINGQNRRAANIDSHTGLLGVTRNGKGFLARISAGGKQVCLGTRPTAEKAHEAYLEAKRRLHQGSTV